MLAGATNLRFHLSFLHYLCCTLPNNKITEFLASGFLASASVRRVELVIEPGQSLGLMIRGGVEYGLGIFITGVDKDSVADRAGLMVS